MATTEQRFGEWCAKHGLAMLRVSLGVIFVWFGVLKFCPGLCDAEVLTGKTVQALTLFLVPAKVCLRLLAAVECGIGASLIAGRWLRVTTVCLVLHLVGTMLPLAIFPGETWKHFPYAPTLVGQYILKNLVLLSAAVVVGSTAFAPPRALATVVPFRPRPVVPVRAFLESNGQSMKHPRGPSPRAAKTLLKEAKVLGGFGWRIGQSG